MFKSTQATFVLCLALLFSSCSKMETIDFNKANNTRTVKFTLNNGKTRLVNQKFHIKSYNWFEAKCLDEKIIEFKYCPGDKIDFTKVGKMMIAQIENKKNNSSVSKKKVLNNLNILSNSEEQSSNNEDENISSPAASEFLFAR